MATAPANRIHSKGPFRHDEAYASEAGIYPGMLCTLNSLGKLAIHVVEGGALGDEVLVAEEDALQGKTVDTVYPINQIASFMIPNKGSVVNMLIEDGQDISKGDKLISAGNGKLKVTTDLESGETLANVVGISEGDMDLTGSDSSDTISPVRIV